MRKTLFYTKRSIPEEPATHTGASQFNADQTNRDPRTSRLSLATPSSPLFSTHRQQPPPSIRAHTYRKPRNLRNAEPPHVQRHDES